MSLVLDRHPALIARVVWVDSGPVAAGSVFAPDLPDDVEELPLPPFEVLGQQASLEGLSTEVLERFRERAVPEPGPVLRQPVELTNDERRAIPTTLICCSIPSAQLLELARAGHPMFAEVAMLDHLDVVDLPTGHWPMWSRPGDLADLIQAPRRAAAEPTPEPAPRSRTPARMPGESAEVGRIGWVRRGSARFSRHVPHVAVPRGYGFSDVTSKMSVDISAEAARRSSRRARRPARLAIRRSRLRSTSV